jgi:hypothetical protein
MKKKSIRARLNSVKNRSASVAEVRSAFQELKFRARAIKNLALTGQINQAID